ncbi:hypothetical protein MNBD_ALPHA01-673 [hydrothermal vent metagenome]|uniref:Uncharacterized protein n=1 Tax=hydrothermal vent metagenome TaxID=652676 RepID=A0A3B0S2E1_9ZZZZ
MVMAALLAIPASEDTEKTGFQGRLEGFSIVLGEKMEHHMADTATAAAHQR